MSPIYGTTMNDTEKIFSLWINGQKERSINFLIICISVNNPETVYNNELMAKDTIEKWIEDNF